MKKDFQDRIDEYILGRMADEEKAQFEAEVNQDESKREQLEFTRNVKGAISSREDKMAKLKIMQRMYDREHLQVAASMRATGTNDCQYSPDYQCAKEKKPSKRLWWWASGIAAVFVIGIFTLAPFNEDPSATDFSSDKIFNNNNNYSFGVDSIGIENTIKNDSIPCDSTKINTLEKLKKDND